MIAVAIIIHLSVCRWGVSEAGSGVLAVTLPGSSGEVVGALPARWLGDRRGTALVVGILLPMGLSGVATYLFCRDAPGPTST